jgi:hypothetical protein
MKLEIIGSSNRIDEQWQFAIFPRQRFARIQSLAVNKHASQLQAETL